MSETDFNLLLDAMEEIFVLDKGPSEDEWIEWANKWLPLMKKHGRMQNTVGFS